MSVTTYTPASIAAWEASLASRAELCLSVAGMSRGKLTLYAGPNPEGRGPVAVLSAPETGTYISSPSTHDIEGWMTGMLLAAQELVSERAARHWPLPGTGLPLCA